MSTRPIAQRRLRTVRRRPELRRLLLIGAIFASVFAAAFALGHATRSGAMLAEDTPPAQPVVSTPIPAALGSVPAIEVGTLERPLAATSAPAKTPSASPVQSVTPAATVPTVQSPAPASTVTPPVQGAPQPTTGGGGTSGGSGSKSGGGGSGQGTSFESSE